MLILLGLVQASKYLQGPYSAGTGTQHGALFSAQKDFEPLATAVAALQKTADSAAIAVMQQHRQAGSAEMLQQLQQGVDAVSVGATAMTRTLREDNEWFGTNSTAGAAAGAVIPSVRFFDAVKGINSTADAMAKRPDMHGHVMKMGTTDLTYWMSNRSDTRLDSFISWRLNRTRRGGAGPATADSYTCSAADHPPMPFPACHVFVNHKWVRPA